MKHVSILDALDTIYAAVLNREHGPTTLDHIAQAVGSVIALVPSHRT
ncbi:hypothetical protein ILT44_25185 [Microvirga sp. BT689]|nr:hypothetical protein [Microvirga arvi]MBM6583500.1 hypothetical protein [Microvirga arvi]